MNIPTHGHPLLSREQLTLLAERIASTDGITVSKALRQIKSFMLCDLHIATSSFITLINEPAGSRSADADAPESMAQLHAGGR